jgi:hypothetical protein
VKDGSEDRIRFKNLKTFVMKQSLHITAVFDQPEFLQNLIEQLAYRRYDLGYGKEKLPAGWTALETSSTETYVSGTLGMDITNQEEKEEEMHIPFITSFLFTCIKGEKEPYQLIWSSSLS